MKVTLNLRANLCDEKSRNSPRYGMIHKKYINIINNINKN